MKKMILLATIAFVATVTHGASIKWTIKNINQFGSSDKIASGSNYQIALFYSADTTISATFDGKSIAAGDDTLIGTFAPAGTGGLKSTGTAVDWDYKAGSYYYVALFNEKGTTSATAYTQYAKSNLLTGNPAAVSPDTPLALSWTTAYASPSYTAAAPEPTSGLLLLLGMAGLALKRKRA